MELKEQVAYLRGLIEGHDFGDEKMQTLWDQVLNLFDLVSVEIDDLMQEQEGLEEYVEAIDEDLGYLEEQYYPPENTDDDEEAQISQNINES